MFILDKIIKNIMFKKYTKNFMNHLFLFLKKNYKNTKITKKNLRYTEKILMDLLGY